MCHRDVCTKNCNRCCERSHVIDANITTVIAVAARALPDIVAGVCVVVAGDAVIVSLALLSLSPVWPLGVSVVPGVWLGLRDCSWGCRN